MYDNSVTLSFFNEIGVEIFRLFENQYLQHRYEFQNIPQYQQATVDAEAFKRKLVNNPKSSNLQENSDLRPDSLISWATDESILFPSHLLNETEAVEAEGDDLFDQAELTQNPDRQAQFFIQAAEKFQQAVIQRCRLFSERHSALSLSDIRSVFDEALHHSDKVKSLRLSICYAYENIVQLSGDENSQALYAEKALQVYSLYIDTQRYYEKKWYAKGEYRAKNFEGLNVPVLIKSRCSFFEYPMKGQLEAT